MLAYELADIYSYQSCEGAKIGEVINRNTTIRVWARMKNSRPIGFLL
jgi:hypothetical protein